MSKLHPIPLDKRDPPGVNIALGEGPGTVVSGSGPLKDASNPTGKGLKAIKDALKNIKGANQPKKGQV